IVDGGDYGPFDGTGDTADWTFNGTNYEGAIALARVPAPGFERRVVCEYDLSVLTAQPPVIATLTFRVRGSGLFPALNAGMEVYAYPADLIEQLSDFSVGPSVFVAEQFISPFQPATLYEINISSLVDVALANGTKKVAFRFQIDPDTAPNSNQVFIDALDSDPSSKPFIRLEGIRGDFDDDGDVDFEDYALLAPCIAGPNQPTTPACRMCDGDLDGDVDLNDVAEFLFAMTLFKR
ncbi:MAG TPA: hypothetical protein VJL29_05160, partial [Thermoguttaceae bacterium]|nr:hypothetical protein [Thermoguttaceae bacterium]